MADTEVIDDVLEELSWEFVREVRTNGVSVGADLKKRLGHSYEGAREILDYCVAQRKLAALTPRGLTYEQTHLSKVFYILP